MATDAVQIKGKADVITAYRYADIPAFAVWCKKDLHFSSNPDDIDEGEEKLMGWLELVERSNNSHATYRLALYKDVPATGIKNTTPYDNSFNFKLRDPEEVPAVSGSRGFGDIMGLVRELLEIKAQNKEILEYLESGDEPLPVVVPASPKSVGEMAIEQLIPVIPKIAEGIAAMLFPRIGQVSGIAFPEQPGTTSTCNSAGQAVERLRSLVTNPPGVDLLLCRLADLAEKRPDDFAFYLRSLMSMKL